MMLVTSICMAKRSCIHSSIGIVNLFRNETSTARFIANDAFLRFSEIPIILDRLFFASFC
jgi:hypothetical protein